MRAPKVVPSHGSLLGPEDLSSHQLELVLDEADRCLMMVDARIDEPGRRIFDAYPPEDNYYSDDAVAQLSLAIALLADAYPALQHEISIVIDLFRSEGGAAGVRELARYPYLMDLIRLSLDLFFAVCPTEDHYASAQVEDVFSDVLTTPEERYAAFQDVHTMLLSRLS